MIAGNSNFSGGKQIKNLALIAGNSNFSGGKQIENLCDYRYTCFEISMTLVFKTYICMKHTVKFNIIFKAPSSIAAALKILSP